MLAILVAVGACRLELPKTLASNIVGWETLSKEETHTLSGVQGYLSFYVIYTEEKTIFEIDGEKSYTPTHIAYIHLPGWSSKRVNVTLEADAKAAYVRIPYQISCHTITLLGMEHLEEVLSLRFLDPDVTHDVGVCLLPVTYSESDTVTVSVKADAPEKLAQVFDINGNGGEPCEKSKCKFKGLHLGDMIFTMRSRFGSSLEVKRHNTAALYATHDPCGMEFPAGSGRDYQLSFGETAFPSTGGVYSSWGVCTWIPWWGILLLILACIIVVGSIIGGIMCCYCGICTCGGCCTCWAEKEEGEMVDA